MKTEPSYYREERALAFNVKTYGLRWAEGGDDRQREAAWETALQCWWMDAKLLAIKHGFHDVYACGRSGGWLVPIPGVNPDDESTDPDGYREAMARIRAFGEELSALFNQAPEYFKNALDEVIAEDFAEDFAEGERLSACEEQLAERMRTERALIDAVREYVRAGHDVPTYRAIEAALTAYDEARA